MYSVQIEIGRSKLKCKVYERAYVSAKQQARALIFLRKAETTATAGFEDSLHRSEKNEPEVAPLGAAFNSRTVRSVIPETISV